MLDSNLNIGIFLGAKILILFPLNSIFFSNNISENQVKGDGEAVIFKKLRDLFCNERSFWREGD